MLNSRLATNFLMRLRFQICYQQTWFYIQSVFFTSTPGVECDAPYNRLASLVPSKWQGQISKVLRGKIMYFVICPLESSEMKQNEGEGPFPV